MKNQIYLFLDDEREVKHVKWVELPAVKWEIVRSYEDFVKFVERNGVPCFVSFDHDLGPAAYKEYHWAHSPMNLNRGKIDYDKLDEKTGFHCAKWLVEYCLDNGHKIPDHISHTMNPIGKENIDSIMAQGKRIQNENKIN